LVRLYNKFVTPKIVPVRFWWEDVTLLTFISCLKFSNDKQNTENE